LTVFSREIIVTEKVALSRGSSQQGKALRAEVAYMKVIVREVKGREGVAGATSNWVRE